MQVRACSSSARCILFACDVACQVHRPLTLQQHFPYNPSSFEWIKLLRYACEPHHAPRFNTAFLCCFTMFAADTRLLAKNSRYVTKRLPRCIFVTIRPGTGVAVCLAAKVDEEKSRCSCCCRHCDKYCIFAIILYSFSCFCFFSY